MQNKVVFFSFLNIFLLNGCLTLLNIMWFPIMSCIDALSLKKTKQKQELLFSSRIFHDSLAFGTHTHTLAYYTSLAVFRDISSRLFFSIKGRWKGKTNQEIIRHLIEKSFLLPLPRISLGFAPSTEEKISFIFNVWVCTLLLLSFIFYLSVYFSFLCITLLFHST